MIKISVEDDPPPLVRAIRNQLAARLEDPSFAEATRGLRGVVTLKAASTPQAVTLRVREGAVALSHGEAADAELSAKVDLDGSGSLEPEPAGDGDRPELARWLRELLVDVALPWQEAATRFWSVLERMAGAPPALRVVDLDTGEERRYGSEDGRAYEIHGSGDALVAVLTGRVPPIEAGFAGAIQVRGSFTEISVLSGAGFRIRYGGAASDD